MIKIKIKGLEEITMNEYGCHFDNENSMLISENTPNKYSFIRKLDDYRKLEWIVIITKNAGNVSIPISSLEYVWED